MGIRSSAVWSFPRRCLRIEVVRRVAGPSAGGNLCGGRVTILRTLSGGVTKSEVEY